MPRFIPSAKLKALRDAAHSGDERARAVLKAQMDPDSDFDSVFEDYFKPAPENAIEVIDEPTPEKIDSEDGDALLKKFLSDNDVHEGDDDYDETIEMFYQNFPKHDHRHDHECECGENCEDVVDTLENPENITTQNPECKCRSIAEQLKKGIADENEAEKFYQDLIIIITNDPEISNDEKTVLITKIKAIADEELEHVVILMSLLKKYEKKENKVEEETQIDEIQESVI